MSFFSILYNIIILPIERVIEWVFNFYNIKIGFAGVAGSILAVSLAVNFLALPLYNIADKLQENERQIQLKLQKQLARIKQTFKGDERFMMIQTLYNQNHYHPLYSLRSSLSILIEIPFFIAAYHYLSHSSALQGSSFLFLKDLSAPDALIKFTIAGHLISINCLPVLMTLINYVSGAVYLKEAPIKEKLQLYGLALVFLVILYNSPAGLVCYWILNNIFSLFKNIVMKTKNPGKILHIIISSMLGLVALFFIFRHGHLFKKLIIISFTLIVVFFPIVYKKLKEKIKLPTFEASPDSQKQIFYILLFSCLGICLLTGLFLPSNIISSAPLDFADLGNTDSPMYYVWYNFFIFIGFFLFWPLAIYKMFGEKTKKVEPLIFFVLLIMAIANVFIFKYDYGVLGITFEIEHINVLRDYSLFYSLLPLVLFAGIIISLFFIHKKHFDKYISYLSVIVCIALLSISIININKIKKSYSEYLIKTAETKNKENTNEIEKTIHLSKTKKNVMVLFMDRAIGCYWPYFLEQFPEYRKSFDGFINYKNTLSYGAYTLSGSPTLLGGYEYTPEEMAKRESELLVDKHNEASKVLPVLFADKGYNSTLIDPPWANYEGPAVADFSAFEGLKNTTVKKLYGVYSQKYIDDCNLRDAYKGDEICRHEIIDFNVLQILPPLLRNTFNGDFRVKVSDSQAFIDAYSLLYYINEETDFDSDKDNYIFYSNQTIHAPIYLDETFSYPVAKKNHNTGKYKPYDDLEIQLYEVYCATFIKLAKYFDYLRENGVYDNTRIIIVSDHGYHVNMGHYSNFKYKDVPNALYNFKIVDRQIPNSFDCALLFKDFNSTEPVQDDDTFMTNADAVLLAIKDLGLSENNPFTGKKITENKDDGINLFFQTPGEINAPSMIEKTHMTLDEQTAWHFVPGDIENPKNWIPYPIWKKEHDHSN